MLMAISESTAINLKLLFVGSLNRKILNTIKLNNITGRSGDGAVLKNCSTATIKIKNTL